MGTAASCVLPDKAHHLMCCHRKHIISCAYLLAKWDPGAAAMQPCVIRFHWKPTFLCFHLTALSQGTSEAAVCDAVEAEWAQDTLGSHSSAATLRQIITAAPPSPQYVHYYTVYLRRWVERCGCSRCAACSLFTQLHLPMYHNQMLSFTPPLCGASRLRTSVYAAPPQSMERHSRRAEVLHFALATMRGTSASGVAGASDMHVHLNR